MPTFEFEHILVALSNIGVSMAGQSLQNHCVSFAAKNYNMQGRHCRSPVKYDLQFAGDSQNHPYIASLFFQNKHWFKRAPSHLQSALCTRCAIRQRTL